MRDPTTGYRVTNRGYLLDRVPAFGVTLCKPTTEKEEQTGPEAPPRPVAPVHVEVTSGSGVF